MVVSSSVSQSLMRMVVKIRREYAHAGLCLVPVLCGEDFLHLVVKVVLFTDIHHALDDLVMVDALYRIVVNVILLVGTL